MENNSWLQIHRRMKLACLRFIAYCIIVSFVLQASQHVFVGSVNDSVKLQMVAHKARMERKSMHTESWKTVT